MKLAKLLFTSAIAVPSMAIPLSTLTSCGQAWGNKTPFMIGSIGVGPYGDTGAHLDKDGKNIVDYIQRQYAVQTKTSQYYAYSTPFAFSDKGTEVEGEWTQSGQSGWYQSGNEAFVMSATDNIETGTKESKSVGNATLSPNIDFIGSIGSSINNFISYALQYQAQQVNVDSETNLNIAWGGGPETKGKGFTLDHGSKTGSETQKTQNNEFYEHVFASTNLNGKEKSEAMLKTEIVNFSFANFPLPSYNQDKTISEETEALLDGDSTEYVYTTGDPQTVEDEDGTKYDIYTYDAVPVMVNFNDITQTYLNPSNKDDSFLVNDYYSTSSQIKESIGDQWKKTMPELTSEGFDAVPHYQSFKLTKGSKTIEKTSITNIDERIPVIDGDKIDCSSFIALVGYSAKICQDPEQGMKNTITITGLQNIFPTYLIDLYGNDLFKVNKKDSTGKDFYVVNQDKVNDAITKLLELLRRTGKQGYETDLTKLDEESQKLLTFLGYMFGGNDNEINTSSFLTPDKPL